MTTPAASRPAAPAAGIEEAPRTQYASIVDDSTSGSETGYEDHPEIRLSGEDAQSVLGVSISRTQTRLASLQTPVAVRQAVLERCEDEDGTLVEDAEEEEQTAKHVPKDAPSGVQPLNKHKEEEQESTQVKLRPPSPWKPGVKPTKKLRRRATLIPDSGFRKYFSSFSLPSLPKTPDLPSLPVPSLPSRLSFLGSRRGSDNGPPKPRMERTLSFFQDPLERWNTYLNSVPSSPRPSTAHASISTGSGRLASPSGEPKNRGLYESSRSDTPEAGQPRRTQTRSATTMDAHAEHEAERQSLSRARSLHRSTSDGSLFLRSTLSRASSLGDDTRFESVHEQVNSRVKAIKDSLKDSSFRLPTRTSFHLNAFHADLPTFSSLLSSGDTKANKQGGAVKEAAEDIAQDPVGAAAAKMMGEPGTAGTSKKNDSPHPSFDAILPHLTGDIVIMGGYRGSILRSAKPPHRQVWIPVKVGLNLRKVDLEVGLDDEDEETMEERIIPDGMLTHIGPVDISRRLFKRLRHSPNAQTGKLRIWNYGYDWRLSPWLLSRKLTEFLEGLPCNAPDTPPHERGAIVIAHSCGGLITRHAVNQNPSLFSGVIYAGVPQTCVNILGPIRNGDQVLLSSRVLTAQVNFTFRTSFVFLPEDGRCFVDKFTKEEYPVDFFNPQAWEDYAFSPCIAPALPPLNPSSNLPSIFEPLSGSLSVLPLPGKRNSLHARPASPSDAKKELAETHKDKTLAPSMRSSDHPNTSTSSTTCALPPAAARAYLARTLSRTLAFKRALHHVPSHSASNAYPPLAVIYGKSIPTVSGARVRGRDGIRRVDAYDDLVFASGDGVALARESMLPKGYECIRGGRVSSERGHVTLLGDLEAVGRTLAAVRRGRERGVGLGPGTG